MREAGHAAEGPDLVITKRLLDHAKLWDFRYLAGFSRDCYALRERSTSLVVPEAALVEYRAAGEC